MTEKIGLDKGFGPIGGVSGPRKSSQAKAGGGKPPADRVDFSTVLQEVSKVRGGQETAGTERSQRIAELKAQIANGTYRPDLDKVAESMVRFMDDEG